jgi:hypothetical protein
MVSQLKPVVAEIHLLTGLKSGSPWELGREAVFEDRFPQGTFDDRIRWVFHLGAKEPLPLVCEGSLGDYHKHLTRFLSFPFRASHCEETEPLVLDGSVIATGLCDPARIPLNSSTGILCEVVYRNSERLPLAVLKVEPWNPNCQMIDDYWQWFWNCR